VTPPSSFTVAPDTPSPGPDTLVLSHRFWHLGVGVEGLVAVEALKLLQED